MLMSIVYPIADLRGFAPDSGRLLRPVWPNPANERDFVRHVGMRQERMSAGLEDWVGEGLHIHAGRGIRFGESSDPAGPKALPSPFFCAYRRLFFDGRAVAKFEIGLSDDQETREDKRGNLDGFEIAPSYGVIETATPDRYRDRYRLQDVITRLLNTPVRIVDPRDRAMRLAVLGSAAPHLARLYAASTTEQHLLALDPARKWLIQPGSPLIIVVADRRDTWITLPEHTRTLASPNPEAPELHRYFLRFAGGLRHIWLISHDGNSDSAYTRKLRIHLARLHTEHECLRLVINAVRARYVSATSTPEHREALETYFEHVFSNIAQSESAQHGELGGEPAAWARDVEARISAADVSEIVRLARELHLSARTQHLLDQYVGGQARASDANSYARQRVTERLNALRNAIFETFSVDDLEDLRDRLGIGEEFIVTAKSAYVNALLSYVEKNGHLDALVAACRTLRPNRAEFQ